MEYISHIGLDTNHGAKYCIIPGDPDRVEYIGKFLENSKVLNQSREFKSLLGYLDDEPILVVSSGIGGPSTAIAIEDLVHLGVENFVRVGTCGGINEKVEPGDLVIATGSIRTDGTPDEYIPKAFPAVPDFTLTESIRDGARDLGRYHLGVIHCKDSFMGQHNPDRMPIANELKNLWHAWKAGGALASEMESSTLFIVSQYLGVRAACILNVLWNQEREKQGYSDKPRPGMDKAIEAAIRGIKIDISRKI